MLHRTGGDIEFPVIAKHRVAHINNVRVDLRERERESVCVCVRVCACVCVRVCVRVCATER